MPLDAGFQRAVPGQGAHGARRHDLPRPRGLGRPAREGGGPGQGGRRHQEPELGRPRAVRPRQRLGLQVDLRGRHRGGRQRRRPPRRVDAAKGAERLGGRRPRPPALAGGAARRAAAGPHRHRSADRDHPRADQRRGDLRGLAPARDDHLRTGRLRRLDGDARAHRGSADPRVPRRPLPLRLLQDPHGRSRQPPPGDRRALPEGPRARRPAGLRPAHPGARLRREVGPDPRPGRPS